jgi:hypothetical protein
MEVMYVVLPHVQNTGKFTMVKLLPNTRRHHDRAARGDLRPITRHLYHLPTYPPGASHSIRLLNLQYIKHCTCLKMALGKYGANMAANTLTIHSLPLDTDKQSETATARHAAVVHRLQHDAKQAWVLPCSGMLQQQQG